MCLLVLCIERSEREREIERERERERERPHKDFQLSRYVNIPKLKIFSLRYI